MKYTWVIFFSYQPKNITLCTEISVVQHTKIFDWYIGGASKFKLFFFMNILAEKLNGCM